MRRSKRLTAPVWCAIAAVLALGGWVLLMIIPDDEQPTDGAHEHGRAIYLTGFDYDKLETIVFDPYEGQTFTISREGAAFVLEPPFDSLNDEAVDNAIAYAATLPGMELGRLDGDALPEGGTLSDFGLNPPRMTVTVSDADGNSVCFELGNPTRDQTAYYVRVADCDRNVSQAEPDVLYLIDAELGDRLVKPRSAYRKMSLWPGQPDDRPAPLRITVVREGRTAYSLSRVTDQDSLYGETYKLIEPFEFVCHNDSVRQKVLADILGIDFDEYAGKPEGTEGFAPEGERDLLTVEGEDYSFTIEIGGVAPGGERYLMKDGEVYLDRLGGYGFLDLTPVDLTYGVAFWLYAVEDVERIDITRGGESWVFELEHESLVFTLRHNGGTAEEVRELNMRRLFARLLNFSVSGDAPSGPLGGAQMTVTLHLSESSGEDLESPESSIRELSFYQTVGARQVPVGSDGEEPLFCCNIKDLQAVWEALELIAQGSIVPEV